MTAWEPRVPKLLSPFFDWNVQPEIFQVTAWVPRVPRLLSPSFYWNVLPEGLLLSAACEIPRDELRLCSKM